MRRLDKLEYRKAVWELLKNYRDDEITSLEGLLDEIMAIGTPKGGQKVKVTYKDKFHKELG